MIESLRRLTENIDAIDRQATLSTRVNVMDWALDKDLEDDAAAELLETMDDDTNEEDDE